MKKTSFALLACLFAQNLFAQWRDATPAETVFFNNVEREVHEILRAAAGKMPGKWDVKLETDEHQRASLDEGQHSGRPHEVRVWLTMDYQPSEAEQAEMEKDIFAFGEKTKNYDPVPDHLQRQSPEYRWNIYVSFVVNYYGFTPIYSDDIPKMGYEITVPGSVYSFVRWKDLGINPPYAMVYAGDLKTTQSSTGKVIGEAFGAQTDCRNARTVAINVQSDEVVIKQFLQVLDVAAVKRLVENY